MMKELKLTIDQLKNYFGTGLKFHYQGEYDNDFEKPIEFEIIGISQNGWVDAKGVLKTVEDQYHIDDMFLLCYRLSDLDKFIPELGFVPIEELKRLFKNDHISFRFPTVGDIMVNRDKLQFDMIQKLFEWHFWPFSDEYFEQGLVIDKLKRKNP